MKKSKGVTINIFLTGFLLNFSGVSLVAKEVTDSERKKGVENIKKSPKKSLSKAMQTIRVIGKSGSLKSIPGSAQILSKSEIRQNESDDISQVLRKVPGVIITEEEGFGLRPNIGLRGSNPDRSQGILLMEDGIPIMPAPYSAPGAYFVPMVGRMSEIEIRKGSSQIKYGPQNISGVINFISTLIPKEGTGYFKSGFGTNEDQKHHMYWGDTVNIGVGNLGYLLENYYIGSNGFKKLDRTGGDNRNTGFEKNASMVKLSFEPVSNIPQYIEAKIGYTEENSNSSYIGLNSGEEKSNPTRRYAVSQRDNMKIFNTRTYLRYFIQPTDVMNITLTGYYNQLKRNWFKADVSEADLNNAAFRGEANTDLTTESDDIKYKNNNRGYYSTGFNAVSNFNFKTVSIKHELEVGLGGSQDSIRRFQWREYFDMYAGTLVKSTNNTSSDTLPGGESNRRQTTTAVTGYINDKITFGNTVFTPGVRYEQLRVRFEEFEKVTATQSEPEVLKSKVEKTLEIILPGLGVVQNFTKSFSLFGGVHLGASPPSPSGATNREQGKTNPNQSFEKSINYEVGSRFESNELGLSTNLTLFYNDYLNLVSRASVASGAADDANVGETRSLGLEFALSYDPGVHLKWDFNIPNYISFTYTDARFDKIAAGGDELTGIFKSAVVGNRLPYIPEFQVTLGTGIKTSIFGLFTDVSYRSAAFSGAENDVTRKIDALFLINATARFYVRKNTEIFVSGRNLLNKNYLVSYNPKGPRVGRGLNILSGASVKF